MCMISSYICSWCSCVSSCHCSHHQVPPRCHPGGGNILRIDPKRSNAKSSCWASTISAVRQLRDCTNMAEFRWWSQDMFGLLASPWQVWPNLSNNSWYVVADCCCMVWSWEDSVQWMENECFLLLLSLPYLRGKEEGIGFDDLPGQVNAFHILTW